MGFVLSARAMAGAHSGSHTLCKGDSSPQQPPNKGGGHVNLAASPNPLMTGGEGALCLHPTGHLMPWVCFRVTGSHNSTFSIPERRMGHTDALNNKILLQAQVKGERRCTIPSCHKVSKGHVPLQPLPPHLLHVLP